MEASKMSSALIICVLLCLSTLKMANCVELLCHQSVTETYTTEVSKHLDEFGDDFEKYFKELGIPGGTKEVTKTRLKDELVCCPGYITSEDGDCVQLQTTTETTTEESQTSTEVTSITPEMDPISQETGQKTQGSYLPYLLCAALAIGIPLICGAVVYFYRKRKPQVDNNVTYRVNVDAEMQKILI